MSRPWTSSRTKVAVDPSAGAAPRPSRIRRDPPPPEPERSKDPSVAFDPTGREAWIVVVGVISFAVAISIISFGIGDVLGL